MFFGFPVMVMLMFHGAVFVTLASTFLLLKTACLVLKTVFINHVLMGHNDPVWKCVIYHWMSESGTQRAVTLLHIVISDFMVKKEACIFCLFVHQFIENSIEGRTRTPTQIKVVQTPFFDSMILCLMPIFAGLESSHSMTCPVTVLITHTELKTFLSLIAHDIICRSCVSLPNSLMQKVHKH